MATAHNVLHIGNRFNVANVLLGVCLFLNF